MPSIMSLLLIVRKYWLVSLIGLSLFIIPFFWLKPGEMDLGGDSSRLYFYDPISFLRFTSIYDISSYGKGIVEPFYYYIPFVGVLALLKLIGFSSTALINIFNGIKLAVGFISIYLIVLELLRQAWGEKNMSNIIRAAILSGIFYIVSFGSIHMAYFWDRAIMSHNQIFLNPLIFFLILKFLLTYKYKYLWICLLTTFVFSSNFGFTSVPPFFAFYPLSMIFLFIYIKIFGKKKISWKGVFLGLILFLGIQAFHLLAQVISLFDVGSFSNNKVFSKEEIEAGGVNYFSSVSPHGKAILNLLLPSTKQFLQWTSLLAPFIVITGFILDKGRKKELLLISFFFVVTFLLVTANVTNIVFEFYRKLFYIPGFSMFRVFFSQWKYIFIFFYSLLLGFSIYNIFLRLKPHYAKIFYFLVFSIFIITGIPLLSGSLVNRNTIRTSNNIKTIFIMDPKYEETLNFIRTLPDDGKIMALPLTDFFRQVISGKSGGAYEGPSTMLHLTNKYSFVGYQNFGYGKSNGKDLPYAEDIMKYSREKNYDKLLSIFGILNIRYILHNTDPRAYEKGFSPGSYGYMMTSLPKTQKEYAEFIKHFPLTQLYKNGQYIIYEIDKSLYSPTIFVPDGIYESSHISFDRDKNKSVFIDNKTCGNSKFKNLCNGEYKKANVNVQISMINPTLYKVNVQQNESADGMLLVMQHSFHSGWKLVLDDKYIAQDSHIVVNGYANGWKLSAKDIPKKNNYTLYIKLDPQKYFRYGWYVSSVSLAIVIFLAILSSKKLHEKN